ncbi:protein kinase [Myxococcus sp. AM011]|uniref:serine/threonine-protein kinase n=1 Tax=Myxococcus sp. AM011 TaxID=2745200 RepID=UPI001596073D|nr:serine/threonine-protein kinase [Myxococcus sp. AM011]NVJ23089.1 protein kinase [Myxococcus sp. AM011]
MALQPGDKFGRYELVSWLGRGGMAETWRARWVGDAGITKSVLIKKVLPAYVEDEAFISMFINEARISATLSHGNIAQVLDFGRVGGEYFLAMELVDGRPLHHILKRAAKTGLKQLPVPLAVYIALEMCRGLHYAHTRTDDKGSPLDIVHRDISPDNVLISYEGQVKIVDFGIAKAQMARNFKTEPGVVKGKYLFFSPEQARGREVDARTDVWATGLVLYELLCGQLPVTGTQAVVMMRMAHGEFPSPREVRPDLPVELDDIVMQALAVKLDERFESANAFADALATFLYAHAPRFSSINLAYLVRALFREDMAEEGRELTVPPSFINELTVWRANGVPPDALTQRDRGRVVSSRSNKALDPDQKPAPRRSTRNQVPVAPAEAAKAAQPEATETPKASGGLLGWGAMLGGVAVLGIAAFVTYTYLIAPNIPAAGPRPLPASRPGPGIPLRPVTPDENPPGATKADVQKARAEIEQGDYEKASALAEKCLAVVPDHPDCLMISGASLAHLEKFDVAARRYQRLVEKHPGHPFAKTARTLRLEYERKHEQQSEQAQADAPAAPPVESPSTTTLPANVTEQGKSPDVNAESRRPKISDLLGKKGGMTSENGTLSMSGVWVIRAKDFITKKKYREAVEVAEECVATFATTPDCHLMLGIAKARLNKNVDAAKSYRRFLDLAPPDHPNREEIENIVKVYAGTKKSR